MDSNYETIKSLLSLLVRKSGFDIDKNIASLELEKTENLIKSYEEDLIFVKDPEEKEMMNKTLAQLKSKKEAWENNSEIVGKRVLNEYVNKKDINSVRKELEILKNNTYSTRLSNESLMSSVYRELFTCNKKVSQLEEKINKNDYYKTEEKQIDESLIEYLNNKIDDYERELEKVDAELNKFKELEVKDVEALNKIKEYELKESKDMEKIEKLLEISNEKNSSIELWEKVNNIKSKLTEKQDIIKNYVNKLEENLKFIRSNHLEYTERKKTLTEEIRKFKNLVIGATEKYSRNDYFDYASKMIDENELELTKERINQFNNKKEVIYVDVDEILDEIEKEWNKRNYNPSSNISYNNEYKPKEVNQTFQESETTYINESNNLTEERRLDEVKEAYDLVEEKKIIEVNQNNEAIEENVQEVEVNSPSIEQSEVKEEIISEEVISENKDNTINNDNQETTQQEKSNRIELEW